MKNSGSFMEHSLKILVEGFDQQRLLTECVRRGITLMDIHIQSETEMTMILMEWDYRVLSKLAKNRYRITILHERGYKPLIRSVFGKRSTIAGLILFILIMYYQSTFVSEIRISGYESFTEAQVRDSLREAGLFEGCSKSVDLSEVKLHIYQDLDNIAWIGVKYIGNLAEVSIVEGAITPKPLDITTPCHIIAEKEGYIEKTIAKEGRIAAQKGVYVKPGDILITGIVPITSTAYGTPGSELTERYVHAAGEVFAKVPYRLLYHQEKYEYLKENTGNHIFGIRMEIGDLKVNSAKAWNSYDSSVYKETQWFKTLHPIPISLGFVRIDEVEVSRLERSQSDIRKETNILVRSAIKEKVPEKAQILNKSLKFYSGENIIGVVVMLETLEEIGKEKEIVIGKPTD